MESTDLAYTVEDAAECMQRHLREFNSCSMMLRLLDGVAALDKSDSRPPAAPGPDKLDRMIFALCGDRNLRQQPSLSEVVARESSLYRLKVTRSRQQIKKIVFGATPERRLQIVVNDAVRAVHDELMLPRHPLTWRLKKLVDVIDATRKVMPDLIGPHFNLDDARQICLRPSGAPPRAAAETAPD